ncbi:MAG: amidohydrolase family protein [Lachnospiraceae bacterium]|nr:amidohydrolase family protein [Lachnospiraceae bacterium]
MKYAFTNGIILNGNEDMTPEAGLTVLVSEDKIVRIAPDQECDTTGYEVIDLKGKYLLPGLVNLHVHIPASGKPKKKPTDARKLVRLVTSNALTRKYAEIMYKSYVKTELMSGVTTLRSVGGIETYDTWIRDLISAGKVDGPRILAGDMAVSVPGGHMAGSLAYEATSPAEGADFVRKIAEAKPDLIKLMITGGVLDATEKGEPGVLRMSPSIVKACCKEAHRLGLPVAAHVESPEGVKVALENGVDTIEHGAKTTPEILELFKSRKAVHIATLSPTLPYALFDRSVSYCDEMSQFNGKVVFDGIIDCAKNCLAEGIPVGLGTDTGCPFITHYDMWREVNYFHKFCDVSTTFALYTATKRNAEIVGLGDVTGSIEEGKCADLIACEGNPLEDLSRLRSLSMVMARGKLFMDPKVKKMPQCEEALDKFL